LYQKPPSARRAILKPAKEVKVPAGRRARFPVLEKRLKDALEAGNGPKR